MLSLSLCWLEPESRRESYPRWALLLLISRPGQQKGGKGKRGDKHVSFCVFYRTASKHQDSLLAHRMLESQIYPPRAELLGAHFLISERKRPRFYCSKTTGRGWVWAWKLFFFLFFQGVYILFCCLLALHLIPEWWVVLGSSP